MHPIFSKRIRDVMTKGVVTVRFEAPIREVLKTMIKSNVTGVVVVDINGEAMGVISSMDIVKTLRNLQKEKIEALKAEDVMTPFTVHINPEKTLEDVVSIMAEKNIHRIFVLSPPLSGRKPVGIISSTDVVRELYRDLSPPARKKG